MASINYGSGNHTKATLFTHGEVITFGDGQGDMLSLSGTLNTVTLGDGNNDTVTLGGPGIGRFGNTITLGNGNNDAVSLTGIAAFDNTVTLGDGNNDTVILTGGSHDNTVTLGKGHGGSVLLDNSQASVTGGPSNMINLMNNSSLVLYGNNEKVFLDSSNSNVTDFSTGMQLNIRSTAGMDFLGNFGSDLTNGVIDLKGGIGGFATNAAVISALTDDGSGGTLLSFGPGSSLDIFSVAPSLLTAANFKIE
jgi:hypothetical protein